MLKFCFRLFLNIFEIKLNTIAIGIVNKIIKYMLVENTLNNKQDRIISS